MVPGKEKSSLKISPVIEKIPGGMKGIKVIGIKCSIGLKSLKIILRELQRKKM
jgi:hypothetical protein